MFIEQLPNGNIYRHKVCLIYRKKVCLACNLLQRSFCLVRLARPDCIGPQYPHQSAIIATV